MARGPSPQHATSATPPASSVAVVFERFTDRGRMIFVHAQEEARSCGHHFIGTEHLLLALADMPEGRAGQLGALGASWRCHRIERPHCCASSV